MFISAILVVGNWPSAKQDEFKRSKTSQVAHTPIVCTEILGESVLERTISRLRKSGVHAITVMAENSIHLPESVRGDGIAIVRRAPDRRSIAEIIAQQSCMRVEMTLMMRVAAYVEFDLAGIINFHQVQDGILTRVCDEHGPLELWMLGARAIRQAGMGLNSIAALETTPDSPYFVTGYVNRLNDAHDVRRLVTDSFMGRCELRPRGTEIKPGVWMGEGASVHSCARIVAPAYIGRKVKIHSSALITRCSSLEENCVVERNTVIEDASILSCSHLGQDLDVSHAVIDGNRFIHLRRNVAVTVDDEKLFSRNNRSAVRKLWQTLRRQEVSAEYTGPFEEEIVDCKPVVSTPVVEPVPVAVPVPACSLSRAEI